MAATLHVADVTAALILDRGPFVESLRRVGLELVAAADRLEVEDADRGARRLRSVGAPTDVDDTPADIAADTREGIAKVLERYAELSDNPMERAAYQHAAQAARDTAPAGHTLDPDLRRLNDRLHDTTNLPYQVQLGRDDPGDAPVEQRLRDVMATVEQIGGHPQITKALALLDTARNIVSAAIDAGHVSFSTLAQRPDSPARQRDHDRHADVDLEVGPCHDC